MTNSPTSITLALPKGRILAELKPLLQAVGIIPDADLFDETSRRLQFNSNISELKIIRVRSFDVATFVAFGAAQLGIVGSDVLAEFDYHDIYSPLNLGIGRCRLSVAEPIRTVPIASNDDLTLLSHARIATKYPQLTGRYFARRGIQAESIKLSGAVELAICMGLCDRIVDLVSSGKTLQQNGLREVEVIMDVSARLIVNRTAQKIAPGSIRHWCKIFRESTYAS